MRTKKSTKILTGFFYITALCSIAFTIYISNNSKDIIKKAEKSRMGVTIIEDDNNIQTETIVR